MSLSMLSAVYTGKDFGGSGRLYGVGTSERVRRVPASMMQSSGLHSAVSSATVFSSGVCDATLLLFRPYLGFIDLGNYNGSYLQLTNQRGSGSALDVANLAGHSFNDAARSMLLVAARKQTNEFRVSFRDVFLNQWRDIIDAELAGSQAERNGNPQLTWELWPSGISHLNSNHQYLKIRQRLRIKLSWWPDYDASITYHIRLYVNGSGKLKGYVQRWAYWVESGVKAGSIGDKLRPKVIDGMGTLNSELETQLDALSFLTLKDLYYLPGNQVTRRPTGVSGGTTFDDVTIVLDRA